MSAAACTATLASLTAQAQQLFAGGAPNFNSVRGKLTNISTMRVHPNAKQREVAKQRAYEIVDFTLKFHAQGRLSGGEAAVTAFINGVLCFAGINVVIPDPEDTWFILPTDQPQTLFGLDSTAAVSLPGNPVFEPSLLRIERYSGQLNTKLDQYPGYIRITLLNPGQTGLAGRATVSVCAEDVPVSVPLSDLRLGHGIRDTGFVVTPLPTGADPSPPQLACDAPALRLGQRIWNAVGRALSPRDLHASAAQEARRGGGVSGTVTEFSPFAPVDTRLRAGGGVSGTVTEFVRSPAAASVTAQATCEERPFGDPLPPECFPVVSIRTRLGTLLANVPVQWRVPSGSPGQIAPRSGDLLSITCGAYSTTASTITTPFGNAGVCWRLTAKGVHTLIAKPGVGGDAPAGVTFDNDGADSLVFEVLVTATPGDVGPPTQIEIVAGDGQAGTAGAASPVAPRVRVTDANGNPVAGASVEWIHIEGGGSVTPASSFTDASGHATATWTLGLGANRLKAYINQYTFEYVYFTATGTTPP